MLALTADGDRGSEDSTLRRSAPCRRLGVGRGGRVGKRGQKCFHHFQAAAGIVQGFGDAQRIRAVQPVSPRFPLNEPYHCHRVQRGMGLE